ncbi:phosphotransferase [Vibrio methylphosphonaticus]|uniref:phosphotransferase n=1 Tax=Vibrio methylphosphonaticus TaxID=2946866 RepID=UPI00202A4295|nr:phosphotransferase [Vibrio methylphosphonaticus]MCL9777522.1 aminoglycoside phosphotransferase family protein [Vibrio methylphosphonaticus]
MDVDVVWRNQKISSLLESGCDIDSVQQIHQLWGGYGELLRVEAQNAQHSNRFIVKHIQLPDLAPLNHPRGWSTLLSHQRKRQSYQVEFYWYAHYAERMPVDWVPKCIGSSESDSHYFLLLQDLHQIGRDRVVTKPTQTEIFTVLNWLAEFHAFWLGERPQGLWSQGSYWHLATRPDELAVMTDKRYQRAATTLDKRMEVCPYQTLIHGDAKLANFCFDISGERVSAVDFQYVGAGIGVKDVALFLTSVVDFEDKHLSLTPYLSCYFLALEAALTRHKPEVDAAKVCSAWNELFDVAWADFQRFLLGWCPTHWKVNDFTMALTNRALERHGL